MAKVLIACEFSGIVRNAFLAQGYDAYSCDILPALDDHKNHIQRDVREIIDNSWEMIIAHPPCTRLCNSGVRWLREPPKNILYEEIWQELKTACEFFSSFLNASCKYICIENPIMHSFAKERIRNYRNYSQIIHPWQFGHGETKQTCLWLKNLPQLAPTKIVSGRDTRIHKMPPSKDRGKLRSITYVGIAEAMATQWGPLLRRK